jgi:beta-lactamase superfamily II metal-dependent hydrolase
MDKLTVRLYNVRFGDGVLVSVPDQDEAGDPVLRHILIDVGNAASKEGGENEVFTPVFEDILNVLDGKPLDLYVATHEHMDHVQGLLWASKFADPDLVEKLDVQHVWLPASSHPEYYDTHPEAKKQFSLASEAYEMAGKALAAAGDEPSEAVQILMRNNNRLQRFQAADPNGLSHGRTADCVEFIRQLAPAERTHYVHRSVGEANNGVEPFDLTGTHPFREAKLEIWAPEEDSSDYYGQFKPLALSAAPGAAPANASVEVAVPPAGVDAGAFYNLVAIRQRGFVDNLLAIDKAANNSSIVFCLEWRGWRLLFPGDAELRSWKEMNKEGALSPVHFLKIGHHGSHNGTPDAELLDKILPIPAPDDRERQAAVSTFPDTYNGIPHIETFDELRDAHGCTLSTTMGLADGAAQILEFEG